MRNYTTLGEGRTVKLLSVSDFAAARTVTSCSADVAFGLGRALRRTDREMSNALFAVAMAQNGSPVEARRHLLSIFDTVIAGREASSLGDPWEAAEGLASAVATTVASEPPAVIRAVREELETHLEPYTGVLVPGIITYHSYKRAKLNVVVPLHWMGDQFWGYVLGPHGEMDIVDDDELYPLGGPLAWFNELFDLMMELYDAEPVGHGFADFSFRELQEHITDDGSPHLNIRADHLLAWFEHHRPDLLEAVRSKLAA